MNTDYRFEDEIAAAEPIPPHEPPDAFARMVNALRRASSSCSSSSAPGS